MKTFRVGPNPTVKAFAALVSPWTSCTRTGTPETPSCCASRLKSAASCGSRSGCDEPTRYGEMKVKSANRPTKNAAPGIHQRSPKIFASPITTSTARQRKTNPTPSASQPPKITSPYPTCETWWRRSHQSPAISNGRPTSQTSAKPSIASSIPVPIGPAADSRTKRTPNRA